MCGEMENNLSPISKSEQLDFIINDINNFVTLKKQIEDNMFSFIKYYLSILIGLFAYTAYLEKLVIDKKYNYTTTIDILSYIGLGYIIFVIITGYFLSYGISHMIKKRILYNKEIISLRKIANDTFLEQIYTNKTIFPITIESIYNKHFKNLPTIMILINLAVPFISYYYINILSNGIALNITFFISLLTLIFIPHLCIVHEKELKISQNVSLEKHEDEVREQMTDIFKERKKKGSIKKTDKILKYSIGIFIVLNALKMYLYFPISNYALFSLMLFILYIRYINIQIRVANTESFIYNKTKELLQKKGFKWIYNFIFMETPNKTEERNE